jgi:hypothetical protein
MEDKMTIATNISKALMDITGEPRPEIAILELMRDAIDHRIEKIETEIRKYEERHRMTFKEFKDKFEKGNIPDSYSYNVETDYLEWEGLISRLSNYKSLLSTLL